MSLDSFAFFLFLAASVTLYWGVFPASNKGQNVLLLVAGILFYGLADPRCLLPMFVSGVLNYLLVRQMAGTSGRWHNFFFWLVLLFNLGALFYFKYLGFFAQITGLSSEGGEGSFQSGLGLLLPLGISFYTLQMISYLVDVDREEMEACNDPLLFLVFVFFFPKVLAGPIERAKSFLPQLAVIRAFDPVLAADGCRQILWGLFTKVVIADACGIYVDRVYDHHLHASGSSLLLAAILYLIQIYCDFAGYSNMAVGTAKLFGLRLMMNFNGPLFATDIGDFWRRWHISLSSWMMDYVYVPLAFVWRRLGKGGLIAAILVTFFAVGLWHGATGPSIVFGLSQGVMFIPLVLAGRVEGRAVISAGGGLLSADRFLRMVGMFSFMVFSFIIARAETIDKALEIMRGIVDKDLFSLPAEPSFGVIPMILLLIVVEWWQRGRIHALDIAPGKIPRLIRSVIYCVLLLLVIWSSGQGQQFIYTQF